MTGSRPAHAGAPRRLTRQHFALCRGWLEGAAVGGLHAAYGEPGTDVRVTRRLIATLRDTLAVAARRACDLEAAHLLRLKPGSIPLAELHVRDDVPTLEAYRAQVDPDGFYSEAELLQLYRGDFPPPPSSTLTGKSPAMRGCAPARPQRSSAWNARWFRTPRQSTRSTAGSSRWSRRASPRRD
ncbi:hypothetical protein [Paraburkholderia sediminicola]|uniref:hypothetical protein n=1 Tax=Paraburkholderia sediminicola TaxID=458836 RepID=UPI0038BB536A